MKDIAHVVYSFDNSYSEYAGISMFSLLSNNVEIKQINIYIIGESLSITNMENIRNIAISFGREVLFLDIDDVLPVMDFMPSFGKSAYGRLFLSNFIEADKVFYFDSDTIVNGSISELLELKMDDYLVAGVQDTVNPHYLFNIGLDVRHEYINSGGVIVLNLKLWKALGIESKCKKFINDHYGKPPHNDQGTLNRICKGKIKIIDPRYNVMNPMFMFSSARLKDLFKMKSYYSQKRLDEAISNPVVIHYTVEFFNRPWFKSCTHPLKSEYLKYKSLSPWRNELREGELSKNCKIQNWVYYNCPGFIYKLMIRYIEFKHRLLT